MLRRMICVVVLVMFAVTAGAAIQTLQVQNGLTVGGSTYSSTESFWMRSGDGIGINNSMLRCGFQAEGWPVGVVDTERSLIRFNYLDNQYHGVDVGFEDYQIVGARLILTTRTASEGSGVAELRILGDSDEEWTESHSTWLLRRNDTVPTQQWAGGTGAGSNYGPVVDTFAWHPIGGNSMDNWSMVFDITGDAINVVKDWVSGNDTTDSFILKAQTETGTGMNYLNIRSEADSTMFYRPMLEIDYDLTIIPEPATMIILALGGLLVRRK
ncbi:MAG: hypothetical protein ACYC54_13935 [Sedimentisphaerales bacterium]